MAYLLVLYFRFPDFVVPCLGVHPVQVCTEALFSLKMIGRTEFSLAFVNFLPCFCLLPHLSRRLTGELIG